MERSNVIDNWKYLTLQDRSSINEVIAQQHNASQYLAMAGKYLIPAKKDDSNTNMKWEPKEGVLVGRKIEGRGDAFQVALSITEMELMIMEGANNIVAHLFLNGKTKYEGFLWLREQIMNYGIDKDLLKMEMHYRIPYHEIQQDGVYSLYPRVAFQETADYRTNADIMLKYLACNSNISTSPRIWPHHFDTGSIYPLKYDDDGKIVQSIGLGFAIRDELCEEPYFYVNFWSNDNQNLPNKLPELSAGRWLSNEWKGAILPVSEIFILKDRKFQASTALNFFDSAIGALK